MGRLLAFQLPTPPAPEAQFADAMAKAGLAPPPVIAGDGRLHRFAPSGSGDEDAWYVFFPDGVPAGAFGNWADHSMDRTFCADVGRELTSDEVAETRQRAQDARKARDEEITRLHKEGADTARIRWDAAVPADPSHPYLSRKGIKPHDLRQRGDDLLVPIMDQDGTTLANLQAISPDGTKRFLKGAEKKGCWSLVGGDGPTCYLAEGYATAASIYEATGVCCYVGLDAGNLRHVAEHLLSTGHTVTVVADNDDNHAGENGAAACEGCGMFVIPKSGGGGKDANDYARENGLDALKAILPKSDAKPWLIPVDEKYIDKPAPINWLVKHWVQRQAFLMIHGPSGSGKTFVVIDWLLSIATGQPEWFGNRVHRGNVVYLCGEGNQGVQARIRAWVLSHGSVMPEADSFFVSRGAVDLDKPDVLAQVQRCVDALPRRPDIIAVDTLNRFFSGDENSAQDARAFITSCGKLIERYRCSVLVVHHTGKDPTKLEEARGSSAWKAALDVEISCAQTAPAAFRLQLVKTKDFKVAEPLYGTLEDVDIGWTDDDGDPVTSAVVKRSGVQVDPANPTVEKHLLTLYNAVIAPHDGGFVRPDGVVCIGRGSLVAALRSGWAAEHGDVADSDGAIQYAKDWLRTRPNSPLGMLMEAGKLSVMAGTDGMQAIYEVTDETIAQGARFVLNSARKGGVVE